MLLPVSAVTQLADWGGLDALMSMVGCDFSPDQSMLVTGTAVKKGQGTAQLQFFSTRTFEKIGHVDVDGASVVPVLWHPKLNQILMGNADGNAYVLYDPDMSEKGVMYCSTKQAPAAHTGAHPTRHLPPAARLTPLGTR